MSRMCSDDSRSGFWGNASVKVSSVTHRMALGIRDWNLKSMARRSSA